MNTTPYDIIQQELDGLHGHEWSPLVTPPADAGQTVEILNAATIMPEAISWLWNGWLAAGKLQILAGSPGTGKTTIALAVAAHALGRGRLAGRGDQGACR